MKKLWLVSITLLSGLALVGCGEDNGYDNDNNDVVLTENENDTDVADAVSGPTSAVVGNEADLVEALSEAGAWVIGFTNDVTVNGNLYVEGEFTLSDAGNVVQRKIALYSRAGGGDRTIVGILNLTFDTLYFNSPGARLMGGYVDGAYATLNGDIVIAHSGALFQNVQINGDLIFANQEALDTAIASRGDASEADELDIVPLESIVSGEIRLAE